MDEINIYSFGFNKYLAKESPYDGESFEILEDRFDNIVQSGGTIATLAKGLLEVEYDNI